MKLTRRKFLICASVASIIAATPADAWIHGNASAVGKVILNLGGSGDYPFINFVKTLGSLSSNTATSEWQALINSKGYFTSAPTDSVQGSFSVPASYTGNYVMKWTGNVSLRCDPNTDGVFDGVSIIGTPTPSGVVTGSAFGLVVNGLAGRVVFKPLVNTTNGFRISYQNFGSFVGFDNFVICREDQEALLTEGSIWNPDFLSDLRQQNPFAIRFLNKNFTNNNNVSSIAYNNIADSMSYSGYRFDPNLWIGTITRTGTDAYQCASPGGATSLVNGMTVQGRFNAGNTTTSLTLQLFNGATPVAAAAPLVREDFATWPTGAGSQPGKINDNSFSTAVYNAILGKWLVKVSNTPSEQLGLTAGWPLSVQIDLCNKVGCSMWLQFSHLITDSDVSLLTIGVKLGLRYDLSVPCEYSNEFWNGGFSQTNYGQQLGSAAPLSLGASPANVDGYYSYRCAQIFPLVAAAWAASPARSPTQLIRILGVQTHAGDPAGSVSRRFEGFGLPAPYNSAPNNAVSNCDGFTYAPYWSGAQIGNDFPADYQPPSTNYQGFLDQCLNYDTKTPAQKATALAWMDNDTRQGLEVDGITPGVFTLKYYNDTIYPGWEAVFATYGKFVYAYEGGYDGVALDAAACSRLGLSSNYVAWSRALLFDYKTSMLFFLTCKFYFDQFRAVTHNKYPCWFQHVSNTATASSGPDQWAELYTDLYSQRFQSWYAMGSYNH